MADACDRVEAGLDGLVRRVCDLLFAHEPEYAGTVDPQELEVAARANIAALLESVRAGRAQSTPGPRMTGRRRAEQDVPLATVLSGYRLGVMQVWTALVEACRVIDHENADPTRPASLALLGATTSLWTTFDLHTQELAEEYRTFETERLRENSLRRHVLMSALFQGHGVDELSVAEVARLLGVHGAGPFAVVSTTAHPGRREPSTGRDEVWLRGRATDLCLVTLRGDDDLPVLLARLRELDWGPAGLSRAFTRLSDVPAAVSQAHVARLAGPEGRSSATAIADVPVASLVLGSPEESTGLADRVLGNLGRDQTGDGETLLRTVRAWYDEGGSADRAAAVLHCHPNTVRYRLGKVASATGLSLKRPSDVVMLYLAVESRRLTRTP